MKSISLIQQINIAEKLKDAPSQGYQIGVFIGSFLPFVVLVGIAYLMYRRMKNRKENQ